MKKILLVLVASFSFLSAQTHIVPEGFSGISVSFKHDQNVDFFGEGKFLRDSYENAIGFGYIYNGTVGIDLAYGYSLNNKKFNALTEVEQLIKTDLEEALKTEVYIELNELPRKIEENSNSIDSLEIDKIDTHPNALSIQPGEDDIEESISSSLFRSLCPVTAQPDWATVYINYKGNSIDHKSLLRYLLSYRNHQGFHEECVERIFLDILKRCRLDDLTVRANFLRRGGIEINPVRTTSQKPSMISREVRQ